MPDIMQLSPQTETGLPSVVPGVLPAAKPRGALNLSGSARPLEVFLQWLFGACALVSVLTTFGIIFVLFEESLPFFQHVSLREFLTGTKWTPQFSPAHFGVLPLVCGTFLVTLGAACFTLPMGLLSAIYLSEYASPRARAILKPILEVLAGVPTVVYGFFALVFITPLLQRFLPQTEVFNALSASIAMSIMTLPLVSSLCEDAIHVVPRGLREGAYALGATKMEVSLQVVVPAALSGIGAAFILALSRAVGETMIVALAAGSTPKVTFNPLESIQTMTGYIVQISLGDVPHGTVSYQTIFAVGLLLFFITVTMNLLSIALVKKYRQKYD
jgi:phosphate transport system permease protein